MSDLSCCVFSPADSFSAVFIEQNQNCFVGIPMSNWEHALHPSFAGHPHYAFDRCMADHVVADSVPMMPFRLPGAYRLFRHVMEPVPGENGVAVIVSAASSDRLVSFAELREYIANQLRSPTARRVVLLWEWFHDAQLVADVLKTSRRSVERFLSRALARGVNISRFPP